MDVTAAQQRTVDVRRDGVLTVRSIEPARVSLAAALAQHDAVLS
jgi:hypothetical protein